MKLFGKQLFLRRLFRRIASMIFTRRTKQFFLRMVVWCLLVAGALVLGQRPIASLHDIRLYVFLSVIAVASWLLARPVLSVLSFLFAKTTAAAATKQLFLRLVFLDMLVGVIFFGLGVSYVKDIHGPPLFVAIIVLALALWMCRHALRLAWRVDAVADGGGQGWRTDTSKKLEKIIHDAKDLEAAFIPCQALAMIGAMFGIYLVATAPTPADSSAIAVHNIDAAMANGLLATMTGVCCFLLLYITAYFISHKIEEIRDA